MVSLGWLASLTPQRGGYGTLRKSCCCSWWPSCLPSL